LNREKQFAIIFKEGSVSFASVGLNKEDEMRISSSFLNTLKKTGGRATLVTMLLALVLPTVALAAAGALDTTFSGDGKLATNVHPTRADMLRDVAIQSDGKIVAVGFSTITGSYIISVVRYKPRGGLDKTFSGDGKVFTKLGDVFSQAYSVAIQPNGKIVVAGQRCNSSFMCDAAVVRYNANGSLNKTFSGDGKAFIDFGGDDNGSVGGLAIQPDGKIVVAGYMWNGSNYDIAVYRLNPNGSLDTTFSGDGKARVGFGSGRWDTARAVVLHPDGKISVAGYTCDASWGNCNFAVARFKINGALDTTFSGNGKLTTNFGASDLGHGVALQADGKLVVAGERYIEGISDKIALARYNTNGSLDTTFSGNGKRVTSFGWSGANDVLVDPNGKIVIAGWANGDFGVVRYKTNGSLDSTFNGNGMLAVGFGQYEYARAIALDGNGKYVVGGIKDNGSTDYFALARILP